MYRHTKSTPELTSFLHKTRAHTDTTEFAKRPPVVAIYPQLPAPTLYSTTLWQSTHNYPQLPSTIRYIPAIYPR